MSRSLRILHTSDWHLGRTLCGRRRGGEFARFLDWLAQTIDDKQVDVLLVAGDIFDGLSPSPAAQEIYYRFLSRLAASPSHVQVVIISGNHDSPSLLNAPAGILKALNIHVVGRLSADTENEIISLKHSNGQPSLIVAAVPYPRDRDLRESMAGESPEEKEQKLVQAIIGHYEEAGLAAEKKRAALSSPVPIVGMGHLFAAGGALAEGDGVRNLYVGALGRVPIEAFPACFDYLALGHLHQPQLVGGDPTRRYCGSPLAHSFAEAGKSKSVCLIDMRNSTVEVELLPVPVFQRLEHLEGDWPRIEAGLRRLLEDKAEAWLEIEYTGENIVGDLQEKVAETLSDSSLEVLRLKNHRLRALSLAAYEAGENLGDLNEKEAFARCLETQQVPEDQRQELWLTYNEALQGLREES